jgi:hypothetical protein
MTGEEGLVVAALVVSSAGTVDQYLGIAGVAAYAAAAAVAVPAAVRRVLPRFLARVGERDALILAGLTLAALALAFALVYPGADAEGGLRGSDRDDAADLAARHLLDLEYPYTTPTYLGNYVSQMPGAVLLALPFVAVGASAYQNLFWLAALFLALRRWISDARLALAALWLVVLGSPGVMRELLTGGDLIANNAYLAVFSLGVLAVSPTTPARRGLRLAAAVGLGLALSSRVNVLVLVPLLFAGLARREGARRAARPVGVALAVFVAVTLPFYAYAPNRFSPLLTADKVQRLESVVPGATALLLVAGGLLTLFLAARLSAGALPVFRGFAIVEAALFSAAVGLSSLAARRPDFGFLLLGYGLFALFPAGVALSCRLRGRLSLPAACARSVSLGSN